MSRRQYLCRMLAVALMVGMVFSYSWITGDWSEKGFSPDTRQRWILVLGTFAGPFAAIGKGGFIGLEWVAAAILPIGAAVLATIRRDHWWARWLGYGAAIMWVFTGAIIGGIGV